MTGLLSQEIADYLAVRRSLGFQMARPEKLLPQLAAYLEQAGAATVTAEHALAWAVLPGGSQTWHAYRLAVARGFATWLATARPATEIPPAGLIPARPRRATPYLCTDEEVTALMAATESLDRRYPLRTATYRTLVGLLAATGMRVGEAIGLDRGDADLDSEVLTIRSGKNGKSRLVPLHATTAQAFFTDRLARQRNASGQTVAAYRDTWRLLLAFAAERTGKQPSGLGIADLDAPLIGSFLDHLERGRGNGARTRNARLAAVRSMFAYAALRHPEHAETIARVLAIPAKKFDRAIVTWLTEPEVNALLAVPDKATWAGRRDHAMLTLAAQAGLRVSELTGLTRGDVHLGSGPHVSCYGKGRKERITPLAAVTITVLRAWLAERPGEPGQPLFPNRTGGRLSRDAVEKRLARHVATATAGCPSLKAKNVTAHTMRHTVSLPR